MNEANVYFLDDALDWLRAHVTDAPEDAIARALIKALDELDAPEELEIRLDAAYLQAGATKEEE